MNKKKLLIRLGIFVFAGLFIFFAGSQLLTAYYLKQGTAEFIKGDFIKAGPLFDKSLKFNPRNSQSYFYLGKIALGKPIPGSDPLYPAADYFVAVGYFEKAISFGLARKNRNLYPTALNDAGFSYWMTKYKDKADEKFLRLIEVSPDKSFIARYFVGFDYFNRLNKPKEALDILLPAPNMAINDVSKANLFRVYTLLALFYSYFSDHDNAVKYAKLAIESGGPQNKDWEIRAAHNLLAINYGRQKDFTSAEREIKKANDLAGSANAYNCFLAAAYKAGENYSKAISIAEKTTKTADAYHDSVCLQVFATSYLANGDKVKAKKYMEEYINVTEKFTEINIFVARNREQFDGELLKLK